MKATKTGLVLLTAVAILALPVLAHAEYLIPPSNSAATQYTEAVPTAGGPKATDPSHKGKGSSSPKQVLGSRNAQRLNAQGEEGRVVAEVAAETAPAGVAAASHGRAQPAHPHSGAAQGGANSNGSTNSEAAGGNGAAGNGSKGNVQSATLTAQQIPDGSSPLGEVLGQATGSSDSGQLGLFLPLIVLGAIAWAVAFLLRQRRRPTH